MLEEAQLPCITIEGVTLAYAYETHSRPDFLPRDALRLRLRGIP